jgi:dTDP-4-amino-4,6-dideoxygalactose transaminase
MLVSSNEEFLSRAKLLRSHGIDRDERSPSYVYDVIDIGFDYRMSQLDAAYIRAHLDELDENIAKTRAIAQRYNKELGGVDHISLPYASSDEHLYSNYIITVDKNRDSFALELKKEGVEVGLHYIPLHFLSYYKTKYNLRLNDYPNALQTYQKVMSLPIYSTMSSEEVEFVIKKVKAVASTRV